MTWNDYITEQSCCAIENTHAYKSVLSFYNDGEECAQRSGVNKMNHIVEGLIILDELNANFITKCAFCIHPIIQSDNDFKQNRHSIHFNIDTVILGMEYRNKANAFLCTPKTDHFTVNDMPTLPLIETKQMLIADKIQNKKDFMIHHYGKHQRSEELYTYFNKWLTHLGVDETKYEKMRKMITW